MDFTVKVAFQGERGAFSEDAAIKLFGENFDFLPCIQLRDVFRAVSEDKILKLPEVKLPITLLLQSCSDFGDSLPVFTTLKG